MPVDWPEYRPLTYARSSEPILERLYRTEWSIAVRDSHLPPLPFLIGLAAPQGDDQSFLHTAYVIAIDCNELRPSERSGKTDQEQRAIALGA